MLSLVLIIVFVIFIVASISGVLISYIVIEKKRFGEKGTRIYKYNQGSRLIEAKELKKFRHLYGFRKEQYGSEKKSIQDEFSFLFNSPGEKLLRQALHDCAKKIPKTEFNFTAKIPDIKNKEYEVSVSFVLTDDEHYIVTLQWNRPTRERLGKLKKNLANKIDRAEMHLLDAPVTGYVIFNIRSVESSEKRLVAIVSSIWNKEFKYFISGGILAIVFQDETTKKIAKNIETFIKKFEARGIQLGAHQLYSGSSYAYVPDGNQIEQQNKIFQVMEFFINLSIDKGKDFLTPHKEELVNQDDNRKFLEGVEVFKKAIYEKKIQIEFAPVKKYITNKKVGNYVDPKIKGLNDRVQDIIVRNINNKNALINTTAEIISQAKGMDPVLVDVNASWLIKNASNMKNKRVIYVVNFDERIEVEELRRIIEELVAEKFMFGLRIATFNERASILIKRCEVKFIIIDKNFTTNGDLFDSNAYIDLLTIAEFVEKSNIQIVYEKPSDFIDKATSEKIGLKYFY